MAGVSRMAPSLKFDVLFWILFIVRKIEVPAWILIGFYVLCDALSLLTSGLGSVNFIGHLAGFAFVYMLMEQREVRKEPVMDLTPHRYEISK